MGSGSPTKGSLLKAIVSYSGLLSPPSTGPAPQGPAPPQEENPRDQAAVPGFNSARSQVSMVPGLCEPQSQPCFPRAPVPALFWARTAHPGAFRWHRPSAFTGHLCLIRGAHIDHIDYAVASFHTVCRRHIQISRYENKGQS